MAAPNLFIVYVSDPAASAAFYSQVFEMEATVASPRFAEFDLGGGISLALWSGASGQGGAVPSRTGEVCLNLSGGPARIWSEYERWRGLGVDIVQEPHQEVFGLTFLAQDPDGNLLRVAPVDPA